MKVLAIAWKDLRIELRSREIVYTMAFFGGLIVVVYSFAFPVKPDLVRAAAPGMLWVAIAFAGTIGLGRAFDRERENDTMRALLASDTWEQLYEKLMTYVDGYEQKIVRANAGFQI